MLPENCDLATRKARVMCKMKSRLQPENHRAVAFPPCVTLLPTQTTTDKRVLPNLFSLFKVCFIPLFCLLFSAVTSSFNLLGELGTGIYFLAQVKVTNSE